MSSGSSVFSIIPPKRARMERFILVQSPILAILRQRNVKAQTLGAPARIAVIAATGNVLLYDAYVQAVSNPQNCPRSITAVRKAFHNQPDGHFVRPMSRRNCIPGQ